jgi:hypothetical protein
MTSPVFQYTKELFNRFHYLATWLPTVPLRLGDVGVLNSSEFQRMTTLHELGIQFKVRDGANTSDLEYYSKGAVTVRFRTAGEAQEPESDFGHLGAGVSIEFKRENAFFFRAAKCRISSIEDQETIGIEIMDRYKNDKWDKNYYVVTEIVESGGATILIANQKNARVDLIMKGNLASTYFDLADVNLDFKVAFVKDIHTRIITETSLTPLFRARSVKKTLLRSNIFRSDSSDKRIKGKEKESLNFDYITPDDLLP